MASRHCKHRGLSCQCLIEHLISAFEAGLVLVTKMHYDFLYHVTMYEHNITNLRSLKNSNTNLATPRSWRRLQRVVCYKPAHQVSLPKQTSSGPPSVLRLIHLQVIRMVSFRSAWLSPWSVPSWAGAWVSGADVFWDKLRARNAALPDHDASTMASATCTS